MSSFGSKATSGLYKMLLGLQPPHDLYSESHLDGGSLMRHKAPAVAAAGRYRHDDTKADHVALLDRLRGEPCPVMVSGHPSALYDEALRDGRRIDLPVMIQGPVRTEVVGVHLRARPDALGRPCVSRTPLAKANENRDGRIDADDASHLMDIAQPLYGPEDSERKRDETVYALDSSTIAFCLSLFPWAFFRKTTSGIKLHSLLDFQGNIPSFIAITDAKLKDVNGLDTLRPEPGAIYGMDRAYVDYERRHTRHHVGRYFGVRAKSNTTFQRRYAPKRDRNNGGIQDQSGVLTAAKSSIRYPRLFRRITCIDRENDITRIILTNNTYLSAETIAALYKNRWHVELFFRWIKQHLRIQSFYGVSENAVKTYIGIGISVSVLRAILQKRLRLTTNLYTLSQIVDTILFENIPLYQLLTESHYKPKPMEVSKQLNLFDF